MRFFVPYNLRNEWDMRKAFIFSIAVILLMSGQALAFSISFGGGYSCGLPLGDLKWTEITVMGETATIDMTDGLPLKFGPANFGFIGIFKFTGLLSVEAGMDMHFGYKNKSATVRGTVSYEGESAPYELVFQANEAKWKMMTINAGTRLTIPIGGFQPYFNGGFSLSFAKFSEIGEYANQEYKGTHPGIYAGGGLIIFITRNFAINIPVKFSMLFAGKHSFYYEGHKEEGFGIKYKPPMFITFGVGTEVYL